ncbi:MAG: NAD-dependent epimerase/dehydratase family protein [bacterium]
MLKNKTCFNAEDLGQLSAILNQLKNKKIFITGGTGYMGKCLLDLLIQGNHELQLNLSITILTRDIKKFQSNFPFGRSSSILNFIESDIREAFDEETKDYDFIIHAATPAATSEVIGLAKNQPKELLEMIKDGSHQVLNICQKNKDARCLYISSGAVYRGINDHKIFCEQDWNSKNKIPLDTDPYMLGKRIAESLFFEAFHNQAFKNFSIARCFTFIGPYLPLGIHLAGSSFFTNIAKQEPITINSDGTALRSFMHSYDLAVWLVTILIKGKAAEVYNVGSDEAITIKDFAKKISTLLSNHPIVTKEEVPCDPLKKYYLPNINKARQELGLELKYALKQSIQDAAKWYELLAN